jgi:pimeloyl-ACP methyl ester carboxylesterase
MELKMRKSKWLLVGLLVTALVLVLCGAFALKEQPARAAIGQSRIALGAAGGIEYYVRGSGPSILLLPSFARSASDFNELIEALNGAGFRTVAMQPRGVGASALGGIQVDLHSFARDAVAILDAENLDHPLPVIGHAYGNRVARTIASDFPARVSALILLAAGGEKAPAPDEARAVRLALFGFWSDEARRQAITLAFFASGHAVPHDWMVGWYPIAGLLQTRATAATPFSHWERGGNSHMLVLQPAEDRLAPATQAQRLQQQFPERVTLRAIPGAGHALLPEQPALLAAEILSFLSSLP